MAHPVKSGLNLEKVGDRSQLADAPPNSQRDSSKRAMGGTDIFIEKTMANPFWTSTRHTHEARIQAVIDNDRTAVTEGMSSAIVDAAPDCILTIDRMHTIENFNPAAGHTFGITRSRFLGKNFIETLIAYTHQYEVAHAVGKVFTEKEKAFPHHIEIEAKRADGSCFPAELALVAINLQSGPACTVFIRDISQKKRTEALQAGQTHILNLIATGNPIQHILTEIANFAEQQSGRALCSICRFNDDVERSDRSSRNACADYSEQLDGAIPSARFPSGVSDYSAESAHAIETSRPAAWTAGHSHAPRHSLKTCASWPIFGKSRKIFGTLALHFGEATTPTAHEDQVARICARLAGIAIERMAAEEKVRYLAHYDGLTALPNRFLFNEYLSLAFRNVRRTGKKFAVLFIDLDKFKEVNDTLGHAAGDFVLRKIAARMRGCLRNSDKIARMGGDEFYVLVEDLNDGCHVAEIAHKLLDAASSPIQMGDVECELSASIGISIHPQDGENSQTLLKNADCAMYRAKELGKNRYQFFSRPHLRSNVVQTLFNGRSRDAAITKNR